MWDRTASRIAEESGERTEAYDTHNTTAKETDSCSGVVQIEFFDLKSNAPPVEFVRQVLQQGPAGSSDLDPTG